jgi:hypothetical protein
MRGTWRKYSTGCGIIANPGRNVNASRGKCGVWQPRGLEQRSFMTKPRWSGALLFQIARAPGLLLVSFFVLEQRFRSDGGLLGGVVRGVLVLDLG